VALLALYGLQNRDNGCATNSHIRIRRKLREYGFTVDTFVYEMEPDKNSNVDNRRWLSNSARNLSTYYQVETVEAVDQRIRSVCGSQSENCVYGRSRKASPDPRYQMPLVMFALRQLAAENVVANFINAQPKSYDIVVSIALDLWLARPIIDVDLQLAASRNVLIVSGEGAYGGHTNGFYMGRPKTVATAMTRLNTASFGSFPYNYEQQLKGVCDAAGLDVKNGSCLIGLGNSFVKIRHNGDVKKRGDTPLGKTLAMTLSNCYLNASRSK